MAYFRSISALIAVLPIYGAAQLSNPYASQLAAISSSVAAGSLSTPAAASAYGNILAQATPTSVPTSFTQFQATFKQIWGTNTSQSTDFMAASANMLANGAGLDGLQNYLPLGSVCPGINVRYPNSQVMGSRSQNLLRGRQEQVFQIYESWPT